MTPLAVAPITRFEKVELGSSLPELTRTVPLMSGNASSGMIGLARPFPTLNVGVTVSDSRLPPCPRSMAILSHHAPFLAHWSDRVMLRYRSLYRGIGRLQERLLVNDLFEPRNCFRTNYPVGFQSMPALELFH